MNSNLYKLTLTAADATWCFVIDNAEELSGLDKHVDTNISPSSPVNYIQLSMGDIQNSKPHLKEHADYTELFGVNFRAHIFKNTSNKNRATVEYTQHSGQDAAMAVLRFILMRDAYRTGLILHASSVQTDAGIVVFAGKSGAGKSTARNQFREDAKLDDDLVLLAKNNDVWTRTQIPSFGDAESTREVITPHIRAILFPERGSFELVPIKGPSAVLKCLHIPWKTTNPSGEDSTALLESSLERAHDLASSVAIYRLHWELDDDLRQKIETALKNY